MCDIKHKVIECFENVGIDASEANEIDTLLIDSLVFISFVIELEEIFDIEINADLFIGETFKTMDSICIVLQNIINYDI